MLYVELFNDLVFDTLPDRRAEWDNLSKGHVVAGIASADACFAACQDHRECLQASFDGTTCTIGTEHVSLGKEGETMAGERSWESSWNRTRIAAWVAGKKPCQKGKNVKFPFQEEKRTWLGGRAT